MSTEPTIRIRSLKPADVPAALSLAAQAGVHGVYIANVLHAHPRLGSKAEFLAFDGGEGLVGLVYFGPRGNLLVLEAASGVIDVEVAAGAILAMRRPWRIVLAPAPMVAALIRQGGIAPLVDREQVYYQVDQGTLAAVGPDTGGLEVRPAQKQDLENLMQAALQLNQADLHVDPWRVDRDWLRRSTRSRIRKQSTFVIGAPGRPVAKLDLGSVGPAGVVIEGVYTWAEHRGLGLAARLVATVAGQQLALSPRVCLHVAEANQSARRAYEKCGMRVADSCRLMLRS